MFYRKNLPGWERAMRVVAGLVLVAWGLIGFPAAALGYLIAAGGAVAILTGFFGFCPMCVMVGRKLPQAQVFAFPGCCAARRTCGVVRC
jgi:hypothetical protein